MPNLPGTVWIASGWQLARLDLPAAWDLWLDVKVLGGSPMDAVFRILNPEIHGVIVPEWSDKKPDYTDEDSLQRFADLVWVWNPVTTEWENVPVRTMQRLQELGLTCFPDPHFLNLIQDRSSEKELARSLGGTPVKYRRVNTFQWLAQWFLSMKGACILKTRKWGYDGKWQWRINEQTDLRQLWELIQRDAPWAPLILEEMIDLDLEVSTVLGIDSFWQIKIIGPVYNIHENWILKYSIDPAPISSELEQWILIEAKTIWENAKNRGYIGLLTIEFFIDKKWKIYVNEFAPRPHNSGHASLDSRDYSQNDLWMAAISGRVMSEPTVQWPTVMENILSQRAFAQIIFDASVDPSRLWIGRESRLYDYQKIFGYPDSNNTAVRKLWHINHGGSVVESLWEKVKSWKIAMDEFIRQIRVTQW